MNGYGVEDLPHPDLSSSASWHRLKMFPSPRDLEAPLSYEAHYKAMDRLIEDLQR